MVMLSPCISEMRSLCSVFRRKNAEGSTWMMNVVIFRNDKECANVSTSSNSRKFILVKISMCTVCIMVYYVHNKYAGCEE